MNWPARVQRHRTKGWRLPENTVVVSRPGRWGNPFTVAEHGQEGAVEAYRRHLQAHPELVQAARHHLAGKNLACFCSLDVPCHADVLLEVANAEAQPR